MSAWTTQQWGVFLGLSAAGVAVVALVTLALRAVRTWTAPAPLRVATRQPGPAELRRIRANWLASRNGPVRVLGELPAAPVAAWAYDLTGELAVVTENVSEDVAAHLAPGPGSLSALREQEGHINDDEAYLHSPVADDDFEARWAAMLEDFRVAVEPPMRTARLWRIRAGETGARAALADWRIDTPTGEWPMPFAVTPRAVAEALLIS